MPFLYYSFISKTSFSHQQRLILYETPLTMLIFYFRNTLHPSTRRLSVQLSLRRFPQIFIQHSLHLLESLYQQKLRCCSPHLETCVWVHHHQYAQWFFIAFLQCFVCQIYWLVLLSDNIYKHVWSCEKPTIKFAFVMYKVDRCKKTCLTINIAFLWN